jgi:hypothetical protein
MASTKRAEKMAPEQLAETFVEDGSLFARLESRDHQVLYGRRGTGKTHALKYFAKKVEARGRMGIYVDLQTIGSTGGLYADPDLSLAEAGTRLLVDTLADIHDQLLDCVTSTSVDLQTEQLVPLLDRLSAGLTEVKVRGEDEWEVRQLTEGENESDAQVGLGVGPHGVSLAAGTRARRVQANTSEVSRKIRGATHHHVYFGDIGRTLRKLVELLPGQQLSILLDEWADVPLYLQPLLAEFIRHSLFPVPGVTVKIGAIEQRSRFMASRDAGGYLGIELGADAAADIDLDDFMVFGNNEEQATAFFASLLARHAAASTDVDLPWDTPQRFLDDAFTSRDAFRELVRASEGVPRDAINIVALAAGYALASKISQKDVRVAARAWYQRDKEKPVSEKPEALALLHWIVDRVIGDRRSRGFILKQESRDHLIDWLYDARVLHVVRRGIASKSHAGVRFDAYALDYGCYIDLLTTSSAPRGLFETTDARFIEVPPDDADVIRGAILDIQDFLDERAPLSSPSLEVRWFMTEAAESEEVSTLSAGVWLLTDIDGEVAAVNIPRGRFFVGAARHCDLRLIYDSVDNEHLTINNDGEVRVLCERDRRLYVNNRRIRSMALVDGDRLSVGEVNFTVRVIS